MIGITFVRFFATLISSRPGRCANSTAYTVPSGPTTSLQCDTVVPDAAPRYNSLQPGLMKIFSTPATMAAATLERKGFHTRYSTLPSVSVYTEQEAIQTTRNI